MFIKLFLYVFIVLISYSCSVTPYHVKLYQGRDINSANLVKIQLNMSQEEVMSIIGSPDITDVLNPGRWDYVYFNAGETKTIVKHLALFFMDGSLVRSSGLLENRIFAESSLE